jgi:hypothetical protein
MSEILEEYAIIKGNENYAVSNTGKVLNIKSQEHLKPRNKKGYMKITLQNKKEFAIHRLMAIAYLDNPLNKKFVDHIDGKRDNNVITNLRWATIRENNINAKMKSTNKCGVKGVGFENGKWRARIRINGKHKHLGYYNTIEEATHARKEAVNKYYGEFTHESEKL